MKRFWKVARAEAVEGGWAIHLDEKPLRTPAREPLTVASQALATAIAAQWQSAPDPFEPADMPLTGLANAAIDQVARDPAAFAHGLAEYGETDLTCYRAERPEGLVELQKQAWDPLLAWARRRYDVDFIVATGVIPVAQPGATIRRLAHAVGTLDPFQLAGLAPLVTIGGSLIAALAVFEGAVDSAAAWDSVTVDDRWQLDQWGGDSEAEQRLANHKRDFLLAARFLELLEA